MQIIDENFFDNLVFVKDRSIKGIKASYKPSLSTEVEVLAGKGVKSYPDLDMITSQGEIDLFAVKVYEIDIRSKNKKVVETYDAVSRFDIVEIFKKYN